MKADAWLYPPPHQFRETCCIASMECQAARVICFYRENGALGGTIYDRGIPLKMDMTQEAIADLIADTLKDRESCDRMRDRAREWAMSQDWDRLARIVLEVYERIEEEKS
jgi:glycosyltransferase involved in cell wall biosynthesis